MSEALALEAQILENELRKPIHDSHRSEIDEWRGTLKASIEYSRWTALRGHSVVALAIAVLGSIFLAFSAATVMSHGSVLNARLSATVGVVLVIIGLLFFITSRLETWLSGGQTALVDGLQAG